MDPQLNLFSSDAPPTTREVEWLVGLLRGRDWITAEQILRETEIEPTDTRKRRLRALANLSAGRIAGGQAGYKLVGEMTHGEFLTWRAWMKSQADEMTRRILQADKVFFARAPVRTGDGILAPSADLKSQISNLKL